VEAAPRYLEQQPLSDLAGLRGLMPTVLRFGRYRFFFYSNEGREPPHIHVEASDDEAKFWLRPVGLVASHGFRARELNEIQRLVIDHEQELVEAWDDYFGDE
jgi:Domain of unknown function (DUF4160)